MKAVRLFEFGGPDKLIYGDYPEPDVGIDDVLVKVIATSVSRWDIKYRTGEVHQFYGKATGHHGGIHGRRAFPMPMQLGRDVAGEVVAVGANVGSVKPGDRVVGLVHPENPSSVNTMRGLGNLSTGVDLPGHTMFGGYAQYVARPQSYWIKISPRLSFDQAAGILSEALGRKIVYVRCDPQDARQAILASGASEDVAELLLEMYDAAETGRIRPLQPRSAETTTSTTLAEFAREVMLPLLAEPVTHG